jgi:diguanylate cyclase (GGDEF)-like protein
VAKVLVVDDVTDNVKPLAYELSDHGHEVVTACDGTQAMQVVRAERPDVILLDLMMPGLDGIEVCRQLKADESTRPIPVILVSAHDREGDIVRGLDAGAHDYVVKPFNLPIVLARVRSAARAKADHDLIAAMNARLAELATTDGLTGLKNHRHFREALATLGSASARHHWPLAVVLIDVDHFKGFNDMFGHPAGDEVLQTVAGLIRGQARLEDVVARYGGEEFAALLPATDADGALAFAERVRSAIAEHPWPLRLVTVSLGVASGIPQPDGPGPLVEAADQALYEAKRRGRDRVVVHRASTAPVLA